MIARYHEIALKRGNRARFAGKLIDNARRLLRGLPIGRIEDLHGRIAVELRDEAAWPEVRARMACVFGVANYSLARGVALGPDPEADVDEVAARAAASLEGTRARTFKVATRRADKRFALHSPEVSARVGAVLRERLGAEVDLEDPELTVTLEIVPDRILWSVEKLPGPGGLPVGTAGHVLALLSGGIDSPVAAARMMRRGCRVSFVHFHATPYVDRTSQEKARDLVRRLVAFQGDARLVLVPFGEVQRQIVLHAAPPSRVLLYRRMMMRIASRAARGLGAAALVTGDSLGQVASQTMSNLFVVEEAASLPLFRPLVAMDKLEVSQQAERLGTYEISIEPDQDCCSLFVPKHPETRGRLEALRALESRLSVEALVDSALAAAEVERYTFPAEPGSPARETLGAAGPEQRR